MSDDKITTNNLPSIMKPIRSTGLASKRKQIEEQMKSVDPLTCENRLGLIFDDSGSMSGEKLSNAKTAVQSFTDNCNRLDTSIALYPMNGTKRPLTIDYLALNLMVMGIRDQDLGGTPLWFTLKDLCDLDITRGVIFSDGSPTDDSYADRGIQAPIDKKLPIDTVFLGRKEDRGYKVMQDIAEKTGGIFIHFEDGSSLAKNLKYLSPNLRPMLMNAELKAKIEKGGTI